MDGVGQPTRSLDTGEIHKIHSSPQPRPAPHECSPCAHAQGSVIVLFAFKLPFPSAVVPMEAGVLGTRGGLHEGQLWGKPRCEGWKPLLYSAGLKKQNAKRCCSVSAASPLIATEAKTLQHQHVPPRQLHYGCQQGWQQGPGAGPVLPALALDLLTAPDSNGKNVRGHT